MLNLIKLALFFINKFIFNLLINNSSKIACNDINFLNNYGMNWVIKR